MDAPRLDDLIELVRSRSTDDPLDQLQQAAELKSGLEDLTDALLGHFVDQARRSGATWSQIGEALGVTKQAAQQRHASTDSTIRRLVTAGGAFHRFTPRARSVVVAAQQAAAGFGAAEVGSEHVLLGLYAEPDGIAAMVLDELGFSRESATAALLASAGEVAEPSRGHVPFSLAAKEILEGTLQAALELGHNYIGTEHILVGLLALEPTEPGRALLDAAGITADTAKAHILQHLRQA